MESNSGMLSIGDFNAGETEPDRLYSMQASDSQFDLRSIGVDIWDEPVNCCHKKARQVTTSETNDQSRSGIFEGGITVVLNRKMRRNEDFRKLNSLLSAVSEDIRQIKVTLNSLLSAVSEDIRQIKVTAFHSATLPVFQEMHQIIKQHIERIEKLKRQDATFRGDPVPKRISLPNPASIPKACPEAITNHQEQDNEPNNQEPVNTSKKRGYEKGNGTLPEDLEEVPVDSLSGPTVPLLIGIPATNVLSVGRGSHVEEALQKGRVQRKCDQCCCYIS